MTNAVPIKRGPVDLIPISALQLVLFWASRVDAGRESSNTQPAQLAFGAQTV